MARLVLSARSFATTPRLPAPPLSRIPSAFLGLVARTFRDSEVPGSHRHPQCCVLAKSLLRLFKGECLHHPGRRPRQRADRALLLRSAQADSPLLRPDLRDWHDGEPRLGSTRWRGSSGASPVDADWVPSPDSASLKHRGDQRLCSPDSFLEGHVQSDFV